MRSAPGIVAALVLLAGCSSAADDESGAGPTAPGPDPTWSVACEPASTPVEPIGDLELPCLGDEASTEVGVRDGRPLVIVLWASWCGPCVEEAPEVEAFWQAHGDQIDVLGVDTADTRDKGRWFAEDFAFTYPSVFDAEEEVRIALGVPALPGVAFVAPDGTVAELVNEPGVTTESLTLTAEAAFGLELS
ncbi:TlpA family protein disulfide reductase [Glycomyces sp. L485]|uniref:TlpA family protein disulfide reductase n=1 Tax=Glycomyces sp. L485 TaxID=2909235 RepID=UPI001F4B4CE6|nr:TlpA disulfide reductase family protein [Glycomyces sp. L485]MCH7230652.1 TlpA family protein disulfide reductase [Glycomyces sp. L485]